MGGGRESEEETTEVELKTNLLSQKPAQQYEQTGQKQRELEDGCQARGRSHGECREVRVT